MFGLGFRLEAPGVEGLGCGLKRFRCRGCLGLGDFFSGSRPALWGCRRKGLGGFHLSLGLPKTLHPKPKTPNPKPQTLNPKPQTPNPKLQTPNPNPKPKTSSPQQHHEAEAMTSCMSTAMMRSEQRRVFTGP